MVVSRAAASLLPAPNGPSNQTAPNAQAAAMRPTTAQSKPPSQQIRYRFMNVIQSMSYEVVIERRYRCWPPVQPSLRDETFIFYQNPAMNRRATFTVR